MRVRLHTPTHVPPSVSNCFLRDEYGQVKSVKLLRRGRRLQQAEYVHISQSGIYCRRLCSTYPTHALSSRAVYGKIKAGEEDETLLTGPSSPPNVTPMPTPAFFESQFWRRFQLQRERPFPITSNTQRVFLVISCGSHTPPSHPIFCSFPYRSRHRTSRIRRSFYRFSEWKVRFAWYHRKTPSNVPRRLGLQLWCQRKRSVSGPLGRPHIPVPRAQGRHSRSVRH